MSGKSMEDILALWIYKYSSSVWSSVAGNGEMYFDFVTFRLNPMKVLKEDGIHKTKKPNKKEI